MDERVFVDTNVIVYSRDASEPRKQTLAMQWMKHLWETRTGLLSFQVLQEYYITVTEKLHPGLEKAAAQDAIRSLFSWKPIAIDVHVMERVWLIQTRYMLSWWDALIVSAAQISDCSYLLSEDFQEGQKYGNLKVINPFNSYPSSL